MGANLEVEFLRDVRHGGKANQPGHVAGLFAEFVAVTRETLDIAIYDFRLDGSLADTVIAALQKAAGRGVAVRIAYDASKPSAQTTTAFAGTGGDPAPVGTEAWLHQHFDGTPVTLRPIKTPSGQLMHDKYLVRDVGSRRAAVWTGSANFTTDAWTHQENNTLQLASARLAAAYRQDFDELWAASTIASTGADDHGTTRVAGATYSWAFGPGGGPSIDAHLAGLITAARNDVAVAWMVLTSATILGALSDAVDRGDVVHGIYDSGQMVPIVGEWKKSAHGAAKAALFEHIATYLHAKHSTQYTPTSVHDFMHDKVLVVDGHSVATGSHNFSANAQGNAENSLTITDPTTAGQYVAAIQALEHTYRDHHKPSV
jgi:phosphatidylserine/phosphatidylglycerophosphate/cardiolipin synthase-like enzyme